jgi:hypothetical protein
MIANLAQAIVDEVKLRGPFLSLSDFVNRRITDDPSYLDFAKKGALQAAIDNTAAINAGIDIADTDADAANFKYLPHPEHLAPETGTGIAGFLLQSDLLNILGPSMTPRSDTFVIRAYGDARHPVTGEIESRKWCEAVVQRRAEYIDDQNPAYTPVDDVVASAYGMDALSDLNEQFGRKFEVVRFRWIEPDTL